MKLFKRIALALVALLIVVAAVAPHVYAQIANVSSSFVDGDLYFYDYARNEIFHLDGTNRKLVIPSGSTLVHSGTQTFDDIIGNDASLGIAGTAGASGAGGIVAVVGGAGDTNTAGGAVSATGGAGNGTGVGGAASVVGGAGGNAATSGTGGAGGATSATSGAGGTTATGTGGASGASTVASGAGGAATGAGVGGAGGLVAITGGVGGATTTSTGGAGADITLTAGAGGAASGAGTGGAGGTITLAVGEGGTTSGGTAGKSGIVVVGGTNPVPFMLNMLRSTISNGGVPTVAQTRGGILYQDASGGNVTMTTETAANIALAFPDMAVGNAFVIHVASNHASNTSTIAGGSSVTLVGSGAVTQLGGTFILVKTAGTPTFDLVRVG